MARAEYPYVWVWKARLPERRGQRLRVLARGSLNACLVEFEDGWRCVTSRNALRRATDTVELDAAVGRELYAAPGGH